MVNVFQVTVKFWGYVKSPVYKNMRKNYNYAKMLMKILTNDICGVPNLSKLCVLFQDLGNNTIKIIRIYWKLILEQSDRKLSTRLRSRNKTIIQNKQ